MLSPGILSRLKEIVGRERCFEGEVDRLCYAYDSSLESQLNRWLPDVVVQPQDREQVVAILKLANEHRIPVVPRGAGTGQCCGAVAHRGGIILDMSLMNRILRYDLENLQVVVQPGIVHAELNQALAAHGFFFPPDPGSTKMCTLGGMVSFNSSGMRAVKYGTTKNYVLGLEVVLPTGEVIVTGGQRSRALKSVAGYDLTSLFVGSEGTLGVITAIRLKVLPLPAKRGLVVAYFDNLEASGEAVIQVFRSRLFPSAIEILDRSAIKAAIKYKPALVLPEVEAMLLFEVDGPPPSVAYEAQSIARVCENFACKVEWTDDPARLNQLWTARSVVGAAAGQLKEGATRVYIGEDICVPVYRVPEALRRIRQIGEAYGITIVTYGHIGDGNLHAAPVINTYDPSEIERVRKVGDEIHRLALELEGTTTGEHGVGLTRAAYMEEEHGISFELMRRLKKAIDPLNILNPGKMALD
ncbi:FAD-binding oxidoreductase [Thermanaeromonas sp. C210]|uniref:FAD-binding oxidoreductase n=1 Tax=Thermanaeromonas sp. C210 TaxID=2731925 RepID=UPI00155D37CA|nr:FAD-linked oxidase C-terminal domain-containing protein [Thermanaeromonas sp. C210]GFN21851.1 FAD-binding oxidoreductase [Thermanaeromonas sp. C210]